VPQALEELGRRFTEETGMCVQTAVTGTQRPLGTQIETALLRIAQEALANVRKHAAASQVTVTLSYLDDVVVLDVADDGVGFDQAAAQAGGGLGLHAMRERVTQLAGNLTIESAPAQGTTVAAELPTASGRQPE
jgi:signal transduction histidine kinase